MLVNIFINQSTILLKQLISLTTKFIKCPGIYCFCRHSCFGGCCCRVCCAIVFFGCAPCVCCDVCCAPHHTVMGACRCACVPGARPPRARTLEFTLYTHHADAGDRVWRAGNMARASLSLVRTSLVPAHVLLGAPGQQQPPPCGLWSCTPNQDQKGMTARRPRNLRVEVDLEALSSRKV